MSMTHARVKSLVDVHRTSSQVWAVAVATALIVVAELCVVFVSLRIGVALHGLIVFALLNYYIAATRRRDPIAAGAATRWDVLVVLALVPLLRILSATMAVRDVSELYQYLLIGIPVLLAAVLATRLVAARRVRTWARCDLAQATIALLGVPLGLLGYVIARPAPLSDARSWATLVLGPPILLIFTGLTEELVFRGVLQQALVEFAGDRGLVLGGLLYAVAYLGVRPWGYAAFAVGVGLVFAVLVYRTRSLAGVALAHGLLNIGVIIVWPILIG
jgi:uncharacterized protein